jgi:phage-related protein
VGAHKTTFQAIAISVLTVVGAMKAWTIANAIWTGVTKAAAAAQLMLDAAMDANPIGLVILAVAALVAGFVYLWTHSAAFRDFWIGLWDGIKTAALAVGNWFTGPFVGFFVGAWNGIKAGAQAVGNFFTVTIPGWFHAMVNEIVALPGQLLNAFVSGLSNLVYFVGFALGTVVREWLALPGQVWALVRSLWSTTVGLWSAGTNAVVSFAVALPGRVVGFLSSLPGRVEGLFSSMWSRAVSATSNGVSRIISAAESLPGRLYSAGTAAIQGLINGVTGAAGRLFSLASSLAGQFLSGFKHALGIASPSRVFQFEVAGNIGEGLVRGIISQQPPVYAAAQALAQKTTGPFDTVTVPSAARGTPATQTPGRQTVVTFAGSTDTAFATAFMRLVREGVIQIS